MLILIALVCAFAAAAAGGFIFSFLTTTLRTNQNVTGLTLSIFGAGIANFFGGSLNKLAGGVGQISVERTSRLFRAEVFGWLPLPETLKQMFFDYGFMVYQSRTQSQVRWRKPCNSGCCRHKCHPLQVSCNLYRRRNNRARRRLLCYGLHQGNMGKRRND